MSRDEGEHSEADLLALICNSTLCWKCHALLDSACAPIVIQTEESGTLSRRLTTTETPYKSADEGCLLCQRLLVYMSSEARNSLRRLSTERLMVEHCLTLEGQNVAVLFLRARSEASAEWEVERHESSIWLDPAAWLQDYMNYGPIEADTGSVTTWSLVSDWLTECTTTHTKCAAAIQDPDWLPCRLIKAAPGEPIRLVVTNTTPSSIPVRYATLSHCWGSNMPLQLTSENLPAFTDEIFYTQLPRTFQDGIEICRRLDIEHIWIDSLCIIQDSEQDWQEQSAVMGQIYANSHINISAAHAGDSTVGCFSYRDPVLLRPLVVELGWGRGNDGGARQLYCPVQDNYMSELLNPSPLNRRAWAFQEGILARRNLIMDRIEVSFRCCEGAASETWPRKFPPRLAPMPQRAHMMITGEREEPLPTSSLFNDCHKAGFGGFEVDREAQIEEDSDLDHTGDRYSLPLRIWYKRVDAYSIRRLTYSTDKLMALSAVAREMQHEIQSEYLAGMWRRGLEQYLTWQSAWKQTIPRNSRNSRAYIAPSWSWAAVDCKVFSEDDTGPPDQQQPLIEIVDVHVELVNNANPYGQVKGGYLHIQGSLARSSIVVFYTSTSGSIFLGLPENTYGANDIYWDREFEKLSAVGQEFYLLPIRQDVSTLDVYEKAPTVAGIILQHIGPGNYDYRRVGKFDIMDDPSKMQEECRQYAAGVGVTNPSADEWGPRHSVTIW
ncbi:heterokaryon incompatibility protein-domain-containing protein [Xylariales sp. PMI_506]|nr:heterokaryon incompatibility protein-domain-containing protein [Xylariales sp. PMI_506]